MSAELKACPFCKSRKLRVIEMINSYVLCHKCLTCGPEHATREKAVEAWNTRAGEKA